MRHVNAVPVIATADMRSTLDYYERVLGFERHFVFGDPPVYAGVRRDEVLLYVTLDEALASAIDQAKAHPDVFLWVDGVDDAYAEHRARGATIVEEIADRPWDARQYVVADPNGYHLKFAQPLEAEG